MGSTYPLKDKLTKRLLPSIFIALPPIALLCLFFFYPLSFAPFFSPITQQHSSLSASISAEKEKAYENPCDYSNGKWVSEKRGPLYNGTTCKKIKKSHNCIINGRPDSGYLYRRWKPNECNLPRLEPNTFLQLCKNNHIAFIGDSLARNQLESVSKPILLHHKGSHWWHFPSHNATFSSYWSPFLVKGVQRKNKGPLYNTMYLDYVNERWARDMDKMDLIVLSPGHWFMVPSVYYEGGSVLGGLNCPDLNYTDIGFYVPLRKALRTALDSIIERKAAKGNGIDVIITGY